MTSVLSAVAGSATSSILGGLFGGGDEREPVSQGFNPVNISAGGLESNFADNRISLSSPGRNASRIADIDAQIASLSTQRGLPVNQDQFNELGRPSFAARQGLSGGGVDNSAAISALQAERAQLVANDGPSTRQGLVGNVSNLFGLQAQELAGLRAEVEPGFGRLSQAQDLVFSNARTRFDNQRTAAIGNLRENLSRRRALGSSFAGDAEGRLSSEFALSERELTAQESETKARTFLQELDLKNNLISQQFDANRSEFQTLLDELNLQTDVALQLATGVNSQLGANARLEAQLASQEAAGAGSFFGQLSQPISSAVSDFVSTKIGGALSPGGTPQASTFFGEGGAS